MAAVQLNFTLRTSTNVKTVHLLGSWDNYSGQLPLSKDAKPGSWKGTFRFQGSMLQLGQRYWYYYIIDGYHVSHDPAHDFTTESTTGRKLNILDVPSGKGSPAASTTSSGKASSRGSGGSHGKRASVDIPKGRALSPSKIQHPKPEKPYASRHLRETDYNGPPTVDELTERFGHANLDDDSEEGEVSYMSNSPPSSVGSSLSSRSSGSSPSSLSSQSDYQCRCERYGITRKGERVKIDCGGSRCGYSDESSSACSSESEDSDYKSVRPTRRQGVVVRR